MTADELLRLHPDRGSDHWLFSGELVERRNPNRFHSPAHSSAVMAVSSLLGEWCRVAGTGKYRAYGYGCPYLLRHEPDTLLSFDASIAPLPSITGPEVRYLAATPALAVEVKELAEDESLVARLIGESLRLGVPEVWVIDPVEESVTTHTAAGQACYFMGKLEVRLGQDWPPLRCRAEDLFG